MPLLFVFGVLLLLILVPLLSVQRKDLVKVKLPLVSLIKSSCRSYSCCPPPFIPAHSFSGVLTHQVSCLNFISRPKTRGSNGTCHHTWFPPSASLYSGQWCFVSRSRSNASHQTIWTIASNWTSKVSTISQPVHVSQRPPPAPAILSPHHLIFSSNLAHFMELFHPFNHFDC